MQELDPDTEIVTRVRDYSDFDYQNPNIEYEGKFYLEKKFGYRNENYNDAFVDKYTKDYYENSIYMKRKYEDKETKILVIS